MKEEQITCPACGTFRRHVQHLWSAVQTEADTCDGSKVSVASNRNWDYDSGMFVTVVSWCALLVVGSISFLL